MTKDFPNASETFRRLNPHLFAAGGLPSGTKQQRNPVHEPVAKDAGKTDGKGFRFVRVTSYRCHLCDRRNLWEKAFIDALVEAQILVDDSEAWAEIDVRQIQVTMPEDERTEIEVSDQRIGVEMAPDGLPVGDLYERQIEAALAVNNMRTCEQGVNTETLQNQRQE